MKYLQGQFYHVINDIGFEIWWQCRNWIQMTFTLLIIEYFLFYDKNII